MPNDQHLNAVTGYSLVTVDTALANETPGGRERRKFVTRVYSILAIAITITLANGLLCLVFMSQFVEAS